MGLEGYSQKLTCLTGGRMGAFGSLWTMLSGRCCCFSYWAFSQSCCSCNFLTCTHTHVGTRQQAEPLQVGHQPQLILLLVLPLDLHKHMERTCQQAQ